MPWFRVDDTLHSHPKTRRAGLAALGLWAIAGSYCCQYTTEGFVPDWFVLGHRNGARLAQQLINAGLWYRVEATGTDSQPHSQPTHNSTHNTHYSVPSTNPDSAHESGYQFHDWHHFQMSKEEILADREHNRERQRRFREKKREARNAISNGVSNGGSNGTPTLPNPTSTKEVSSSGYESNANEDPQPADEPRSKPVDVSAVKVARAYTDIVKLSDKGKVSGVVMNARLAGFTDAQITPALTRLANQDMPVTADTLRYEINGRRSNGNHNRGPKEIPGAGGGMAIQL